MGIEADIATDSLAVDSLGWQHIFGDNAVLISGNDAVMQAVSLTDNSLFRICVLALAVYYALTLLIFGGYTGQMAKIIVNRNVTVKLSEEFSYLFISAVKHSTAIGILMWSLTTVRWLETCGVRSVGAIPAPWTGITIAAAVTAVFVAGWLLTQAVCRLARRNDIADGLTVLSGVTIGFSAMVATPFALMFVLNQTSSQTLFGIIMVIIAASAFLILVIKSLIFFIEQKISILLWFLYLCTVVIIPIGIVVTLLLRSGTA